MCGKAVCGFFLLFMVVLFGVSSNALSQEKSHAGFADRGDVRPIVEAEDGDPLKASVEKRATWLGKQMKFFFENTLPEVKKSGKIKDSLEPTIEEAFKLVVARIEQIANQNDSILPGKELNLADESVLLTNLRIMKSYLEALYDFSFTDAGEPIPTAWNVGKRWGAPGYLDLNEAVVDKNDPRLSEFGRKEIERRDNLIVRATPEKFREFAQYLITELKRAPVAVAPATELDDAARGLKRNASEYLREEGGKLVEAIKKNDPTKSDEAKKAVDDYRKAQASFDRWYDKNVRDKDPLKLGEGVLNELKTRSKEVRDLERSVHALVDKVRPKIHELGDDIERFKKDPQGFIKKEGDRFIADLRKRDPERADKLEALIREYKEHLKKFEADLEQFRGKNAREVADELWQRMTTESKALRDLERDVRSVVDQFEEQRKKAESELKGKKGDIEASLDRHLRNVKQDAGKAGEGIKKDYETTRRKVEKDLNDLLKRK